MNLLQRIGAVTAIAALAGGLLAVAAGPGGTRDHGPRGERRGLPNSPRLSLVQGDTPLGVYLGDIEGLWTVANWDRTAVAATLNGDPALDLWPSVARRTIEPFDPWVVWSRFNGTDYDLVWSHWSQDHWTTPQSLESDPKPAHDLDAKLAFDPVGRPYVVWWRLERGRAGQVYLSAFRSGTWTLPFRVSNEADDSRFPVLAEVMLDKISVQYQLPRGLETRVIHFPDPATITDDINPQFAVEVTGDVRGEN